jgi:hypothetical protein
MYPNETKRIALKACLSRPDLQLGADPGREESPDRSTVNSSRPQNEQLDLSIMSQTDCLL